MKYTCGIYLYNLLTDTFLIGHVTNTKAYSIPKGKYDSSDNDFLSAAMRELKEETNIDISSLNIIFNTQLLTVPYTNQKKVLIPFLYIINENIENLDIKCISFFDDKDGNKLPEIDNFLWVNIFDSEKLLPISQKKNLMSIRKIVNNINQYF